tara:strand:+ start:184 stop:525 length:342 start_codon:yes stop_codon:yes gene_type:complete
MVKKKIKCYDGASGNVVCPNSRHNPKNPNYQKELAKDRANYKPVPKSQDGRGRPRQFTKEEAKERQQKRDRNRKRPTPKKRFKPYRKKTDKKQVSKEPFTFKRTNKPITISWD